ncbi:MAG: hypothetical protein H7308_14860 [Chthonomonadaceae bacterium]|nr:hypothetical protein [Chthonomonadaceae bacterium]
MMSHIFVKIPKFAQATALLTLAAGGVVLSRFFNTRNVNGAERLTNALLDTESLQAAARRNPEEASAQMLADCAAYAVRFAFLAAEGVGPVNRYEDAGGTSRTHTHPYTRAVATVLTENNTEKQTLTYAVSIPDVAEVRGTRTIGQVRLSGLSPARPIPETLQITLGSNEEDGYSAQIESELEVADYLVTGRVHLSGSTTLRDNVGNVGRVNIAYDGSVSGTITRDAHVIGRFEGQVNSGIQYRQYQLEGSAA